MVRVYLLGDLRVIADDAELTLPSSRKARALLALLALERRAHGRSELAGRLWPDVREDSARASLRTELSKLRAALGAAADCLLHPERDGGVALADDVWTDVGEVEALLAAGEPEAALDRCRPGLLAGLEDDWVHERRDELRDRCGEALAAAAAKAEAAGDLDAAVGLSQRLATLDPLAEMPHRDLIRRLAAAGDRAAALAAYDRFRERLAGELRIVPSAATRRLADEIRADQPARAGAPAVELPPVRPAGARSPLVGRSAEFAALRAAWDRARGGDRRVVAISGEPGIGKTRLAAELCALAHAGGALVLLGRCHEDRLIPYEPFAEALRRYAAASPPQQLQDEAGVHATALGVLVPDIAHRIERSEGAVGEISSARIVEALVAFLREAARARPTVLLLEDLHWAEEETALALRHLVRATEGVPLLVLVSLRSVELSEEHAITGALAEARRARALSEIALSGLDADAVASIVAVEAGAQTAARLAPAVHARTDGNPFFVEELVRDAHELASPEQLALPQSVKDLILRRLHRLRAEDLRVLEVAAVIGREFDLATVRWAAGGSEEQLVDSLDAAFGAHAIVAGADPQGYAFAHALVHESVYQRLSPARRAHLHRRVGEAIDALGASDDRTRAAALARHFSAAGEWARAFEHHMAAARGAARVGALRTGVEHCDAALHAVRAVHDIDLGDVRAAAVALQRGRLLHRAERLEPSLASLEHALAGARAGGARALELEVLIELGHVWRSVDVRRAPPALEAALALAEQLSDTDAQVRALSRNSLVQCDQLRLDRAAEDGERALVLARRSEDERLVAEALDALKLVAWQLGDMDRLAEITAQLESIQRRRGELWYLCWTLLEGAQVPIAALRWPETQKRLVEALALADEMGAHPGTALILDSLAVVDDARGAPEAAIARCVRALELLERGGSVSFVGWVEATAAHVLLRLGATSQAVERLEHGLAMAQRSGSRHETLRCTALLARALLAAGERTRALALAQRAEQLCGEIRTPPGRALLYLAAPFAATAEVLAAGGAPERGERLVAGPLRAASGPDKAWFAIPLSVAMARCLRAQGRLDAAQHAIAPAVCASQSGAFVPAWEALVELADMQAAAGNAEAAQKSRGTAHEVVATLYKTITDPELRAGLAPVLERATATSPGASAPP